MAKTPNSSPDSYCTPEEFLELFDRNFTGMLVDDDGNNLTAGQLATDAKLEAALKSASGEFETACLIGEKYQPEDILALLDDDGVAAARVREIVAVLALERVSRRRGPVYEAFKPALDDARKTLEDLREGKRVLPLVEAQQAGLPTTSVYTPEERRENNLVSRESHRFFGRRQADRRWPN